LEVALNSTPVFFQDVEEREDSPAEVFDHSDHCSNMSE
jgi:hypothetical protein